MLRAFYVSFTLIVWLLTCVVWMAVLASWATAAEPVDFEPLLHRQPAVSFAAAELRRPATSAPPVSFAALLHRQAPREPADPPAARPPAAVPATTAAAGGFWQQQCTKRGCRLIWIPHR